MNGLAKKFTDRLSALGYAFARAIPNPVVDPENPDEVSVVYTIDPGRRVYVRKVNITGNTRTQDEVIRRMKRAGLTAIKLPFLVTVSTVSVSLKLLLRNPNPYPVLRTKLIWPLT